MNLKRTVALLLLALFLGVAWGITAYTGKHAGIPKAFSKETEGFLPAPVIENKGDEVAGGEQGRSLHPPSSASSPTLSTKTKGGYINMRIATYNVHKCQGMDGRTRPERVAAVLKKFNADVVALQEVVGGGPGGRGQEEELGARLSMTAVLAPARQLGGHGYGNALLSRFPIQNHTAWDLSQKNLEPRFCQRVDVLIDGIPIHIFNVHFGTSRRERARQARQLVPFLCDPSLRGPKILLGDFNEWTKGPATEILCENFQPLQIQPLVKWPKTYPGVLPVFSIDQIYYQGQVKTVKVQAPRTWLTMTASDHLPIMAELKIQVDR